MYIIWYLCRKLFHSDDGLLMLEIMNDCKCVFAAFALMLTASLTAQNPIICDRYTPDPAPYVHGDTLYLFVDHDEDVTENGYFTMKDSLLY